MPVYRVSDGKAAPAGRYRLTPGDPPPPPAPPSAPGGWPRLVRHARVLGALWPVLLTINLSTGPGLWAQGPGLAILVLLGVEAAPILARGRFGARRVRALMVVAGLVGVNLLSWTGTFRAIWPGGAVLALILYRMLLRPAR